MKNNHTPELFNDAPQAKVKEFTPTLTQILSYKQVKESGSGLREKEFVFLVMEQLSKPCSRREIQEISGLPVNHLTRVFKDLETEKKIRVEKLDTCRYTKRKVQFYSPLKCEANE